MSEEETPEVKEGEEAKAEETPPKPILCRLMEAVGSIPKDGQNDFHHYRFVSASAVLNKVREALVELGIESVPQYQVISQERLEKGILVTVRCELSVRHNGMTVATSISYGSGMDTGDKAVMKAMTAAHKYCWMHLLNISTEDDPEEDTRTDANAETTGIAMPKATEVARTPVKLGEGNPVVMAKVTSTVTVTKTRTGGNKYVIHTSKGDFNTFNKDEATAAEVARSTGAELRIEYVETKWGKDIVAQKKPAE
jgi:hypothetical protein